MYADYQPQAGRPLYTRKYGQFFDPLLFSSPIPNTTGTTSRDQFREPGINNWNISVYKTFLFNERARLQLRLDTFNTFNHTQFATVVNSINSQDNNGAGLTSGASGTVGNSGSVSSTYDPRNLQLAAKFFF